MQDLIRNLPAVIFEYAIFPDGRRCFNFVSESASSVLGVTADELTADPDLLHHVIDREDARALEKFLVERGAPDVISGVRLRLSASSESRRIEILFSDEVSRENVLLRRGIMQNIREEDVTGLQESTQYEALLERLPIGVVIHYEGTVLFANTHAHSIMGARPGALTGLKALDFVHRDNFPGISERIKQVSAGESVPLMEKKFIRVDGTVINVETMGFPFVYKGKNAVQVIFRDITEKKKTEEQVRKNETLFSQLFHNVPMAVVMLDESGKVSEINHGFEKMFGYGIDELRGKNLNDSIVPENLRNEGINLNNLISANKVVTIESVRKHRSGRLINVILCGVPVMFENEAIGIYGVYVDISDRKKVEEELKIRNAELDNFVYKVSHDLRAPLSSVLGLVNLSKLQGNTDNPLEYIELIGEKIQALDNFIGDVLSHSKNLKMEVEIGRVDFSKIIEQTFTDLSYLKGARHMKWSVKNDGIDFYSDHWRVSEIFRNLISNAIKYRKPDSDESEIIIKINVDHLCADITFADNGIGIKDANLRRVFEMFYRATDQGEGSGIGLYIVKNAVDKLGGQIKVASSPGQGTRFHILLPNRINSALSAPAFSQERR